MENHYHLNIFLWVELFLKMRIVLLFMFFTVVPTIRVQKSLRSSPTGSLKQKLCTFSQRWKTRDFVCVFFNLVYKVIIMLVFFFIKVIKFKYFWDLCEPISMKFAVIFVFSICLNTTFNLLKVIVFVLISYFYSREYMQFIESVFVPMFACVHVSACVYACVCVCVRAYVRV